MTTSTTVSAAIEIPVERWPKQIEERNMHHCWNLKNFPTEIFINNENFVDFLTVEKGWGQG